MFHSKWQQKKVYEGRSRDLPSPPSLILHPWILEKAPRHNGKSTQLNKFWVRKVLDDFPFPNDWFWIYFLNTSVRKFCETGWFFTNSPKFCAGNRRAVGQELKFAHASLWSLCWQMLGKSSICTYNYLSFDIYHQAFAGKKGKNERFRMSIMSRKRNNRLITRIKIQDIQRNIEPDHQHLISDLFLYLVTHIFPRFCPSEQFISKTLFGVSRLQPLLVFQMGLGQGAWMDIFSQYYVTNSLGPMTNDKKRVDESSEIKKEPRVKRDYSSLTRHQWCFPRALIFIVFFSFVRIDDETQWS